VALRSAKKTGKPLVLVLNNVHLFNNDDSGKNMLLQLQQCAEAWAASGEQLVSQKKHLRLTFGRHIDARDELVSTNFLPHI
jgi:DNA-directed RNA polymerase beta' subunit